MLKLLFKLCLFLFPGAQMVKNPLAMLETWVQPLAWEDPLEKGTATHSRILAWRIPRTHGLTKSQPWLSNFHFHHMLARLCSKSVKLDFSSMWTENFQMYKLDLEKAEEPKIKLPPFIGLWKKQENSRKTFISVSLTTLMSLSVFSSVQLLSHVQLFETPWITARQASLSISNSQSLLKLMSIKSVMPSSHLILCRPLLLLPPVPPSIRVFSNESALRMRWPKYWSFSFNISPSNEHPGLISFRMDWESKELSRVFSNTTVQKHQFFGAQLSSQSNSYIHTWPLEKP